jgi:hypothetical protein
MEGNVYLVIDSRNGALRTVKILRGRNMVVEAEHTVAHYRKLASVSAIKRFRDWGVLDGQAGVGNRPWLAFDYIVGETLAKRIEGRRIGDPMHVLVAVCAALAPIHRRGFAIGDFDRERNLLVERTTGLIRFCDLDAGGPAEAPPEPEDDLQELLRLAGRMWRLAGLRLDRDVYAAISASTNALQAGYRLRRLIRAEQGPQGP